MITILVTMILIPTLGALSDRVGRKPLMLISCVGFTVLSYPIFVFISQGKLVNVVLGHITLGILLAMFISEPSKGASFSNPSHKDLNSCSLVHI